MSLGTSLTLLTLPLALPLALGACGNDNNLNKSEARRAFAEVMTLSQSVSAEAQGGSVSSLVSSVAGTATCVGGGSVDYQGSIDDGGPTTMDLGLDFSGCTGPGGVAVDGSLDYNTTVGTAGDFAFTMLGSVQFSGAISGNCDFDLSLSLAGGVYTAQGDLCGSGFSYP